MLHNSNNSGNLIMGSLSGPIGGTGMSSSPVVNPNNNNNLIAIRFAAEANKKAQDGDYYGAIELYGDAIRHNSRDCRFYLNRCYCYAQLELFQLALDDAQHAINLNATMPKCYYRKGQALFGLRRYLDAESAFKEVLRYDPDCPDTKKELTKVRYQHLLSLGFEKLHVQKIANQFDNIKDCENALLSDTLQKNVELVSSTAGSVASARNRRDSWCLGRSLSLNQENSTAYSINSTNLLDFQSAYLHNTSLNNGTLASGSLMSARSRFASNGFDQCPEIMNILRNEGKPTQSLIGSYLDETAFNGDISNRILNGFNEISISDVSTAIKEKCISNNKSEMSYNEKSTLSIGETSGMGKIEGNCEGTTGNVMLEEKNFNGDSDYNQKDNRTPDSNINTNVLWNNSVNTLDRNIAESNHNISTKVNISGNEFNSCFSFNAFNQIPDTKLIDSIVPNVIGNNICNTGTGNNNTNNINDGGIHPANLIQSSDPTNLKMDNEKQLNNVSVNFSYSDIVKRAKKPADGTKITKKSGSQSGSPSNITENVKNGEFSNSSNSVEESVVNCNTPIKDKSKLDSLTVNGKCSKDTCGASKRPTNLWGYHGLRVANVSPTASKATLQALFSKFGKVKLIERINNKVVENNIWLYYENAQSPIEAVAKLQSTVLEGISASGGQALRFYFAPTDDQKDLKFSRPKQPPDNKGECYYWRTTNCFSRENCTLNHIPANKNIDAQIWMKMDKEPNKL